MSAAEDRVARPSRSSMAVSSMHASSSSGSESSVLGWLGIVLGRCASHESREQRRLGARGPLGGRRSIRLRSASRGQHSISGACAAREAHLASQASQAESSERNAQLHEASAGSERVDLKFEATMNRREDDRAGHVVGLQCSPC